MSNRKAKKKRNGAKGRTFCEMIEHWACELCPEEDPSPLPSPLRRGRGGIVGNRFANDDFGRISGRLDNVCIFSVRVAFFQLDDQLRAFRLAGSVLTDVSGAVVLSDSQRVTLNST